VKSICRRGTQLLCRKPLALDARQVSDGLVEATGLLELLRRTLVQVEPGAVVVERAP
jgi:hypothetical protein